MIYLSARRSAIWLILATSASVAMAEDTHFCGTGDAANGNSSNLLDDDFRALLHSSGTQVRQPAPATAFASVPPASASVMPTQTGLDTGTSVDNAKIPHEPNAPRPVAKKRLTRMCVLKDAATERELLTLKIPGTVSDEPISLDELTARREAEQSLRRLPVQTAMQRESYEKSPHPRLVIHRDTQTGAIHIDAHNSDIRDVLEGISNRTGKPILFHPDLEGTISTQTVAEGIVVLVRTMLEPFNFSVVAGFNELIVCGPNETPGSVLAAIAKRQPALARQLPDATTPITARPSRRHPDTARPSVAANQRVAITHPVTSMQRTAPGLPNVMAKPPADPSPAHSSGHAIQLVAAQSTAIAPVVTPSPKLKRSNPVAHLNTVANLATERVARIAQDAFASGNPLYATEILQQGLKRFPESAMLKRILGESLYLEGKFPEAAEELEGAIKLNKEDLMANELLGKTLQALGQKERAQHYFLQAQQSQRTAP